MIIFLLLFFLMGVTSVLFIQKIFFGYFNDGQNSISLYAAFGAAIVPVQIILISVISLMISTFSHISVVFIEIILYLIILLLLHLTRNRKIVNTPQLRLLDLVKAIVPGLIVAVIFILIPSRSIAHDVYEYHLFGRSIYLHRTFSWILNRYDTVNGFYFVGLHFPFYSYLTFTVGLAGDLTGINVIQTPDYFRFFSGYYLGMYFPFFMSFLRQVGLTQKQIYISLIFILTSFGFDWLISNIHIDSSRIFFITCSYCFAYLFINNPAQKGYYILFFVATLVSILMHSFGFILGSFNLLILFLIMRKTFTAKYISFTLLLYILCSLYYFLNIIDNGWIFKDIRFY